jgi:hypothetical protein
MWYEVEAASNSSFISFVEITDSRRISLIDRFDDSDSIDSIDCLFLETIFSWIMILLSAESYAEYASRVNAWFDVWFSSWLIQDNVIEIFLQMIDRDAQISTTRFENFVLFQNSKNNWSQYYVKIDN